ncbi:MAG: hypothetical protein V4726_05830 [Verrucomicrobiota bacterium]
MTTAILSGLFHGALFALAGYGVWLLVRRWVLLLALALIFRHPKTEEDHEYEMRNGWPVQAPETDSSRLTGWLLVLVLVSGFVFFLALIIETSARV